MTTHQKGNKYTLGASIEPLLIKEIDAVRGQIPRSRIVERALNWFLRELETGKIALLPEAMTTTGEIKEK